MKVLDLLIIGAGPAGICCGIEAKKHNLNYLIVEKGVLVNSIYNFPTNMTFFSTSQKLEIGDTPFISHTEKPTRKEALEYYRRIVDSWKLKVNLYEEVLNMKPNQGLYNIETSKASYQAKNVVIATGYYDTPRLLNIPGEDLPKVKHFYDDAHPYIGQKTLVIGAANSACDVALETWQKGAEVTMVVRESELYQRVKYWILPNIENRIKEGSIKAYFNSTVKEIRPKEVLINTPNGVKSIENDFVLAMTGYKPNYAFLKKLGVQFSDDENQTPILNYQSFESNLKNVYLAGVIQSGLHTSKLFIENTRHHGENIINEIMKNE